LEAQWTCKVCSQSGEDGFSILYSFDHYRVAKCKTCSFTFVPPGEGGEISYDHFKSERELETVRRGNDWLKFQRHKLRINYIRKFRADGHLFDLGTGWGHFLETARQAGYRVSGVEVSKHQFTYAKEDLGLPVECVDFFQYKAEHGSIDIITMWDVLEHIDEVDGILSHIRELLSREGLLVIQVPQIDSFIAKRTGRNWSMFSHTHVNYFSRKTMKQVLEKNGFEVLDFRSSIELKLLLMYVLYPFLRRLKGDKKEEITSNERQNYFNKVTRQPKWILKTSVLFHNIIYNILLRMNIGEELMVVARKKN
jgi:2-polyprenyl-3-methyl-5-hydroxy-6-metoxy-1,4-benzoquinol methylase